MVEASGVFPGARSQVLVNSVFFLIETVNEDRQAPRRDAFCAGNKAVLIDIAGAPD
jgi:hypothetical protein